MTNKEAIEIIMLEYCPEICSGSGKTSIEHCEKCEIGMAIKAIEKQIPKFVQCPKGFQGVRDTRYYWPSCNSLTRQHEAICHKCGQTVKYPKEVYLKEKNKIILDWSEEE